MPDAQPPGESIRPLRRLAAGHWQSRDGAYTFGRMDADRLWYVWEGPAEGDWPSLGQRFATLRDAVDAVQIDGSSDA